MAEIIDGNEISKRIRGEIAAQVESLREKTGVTPGLAAVLVGNDPASEIYVARKRSACFEVGMHSEEHRLGARTTQSELLDLIGELNTDPKVHGILVQLPLPEAINEVTVLRTVSPLKDVDGFHPENMGMLMEGNPRFISCTPYGIMEIIDGLGVNVEGMDIVVVGRSNIVGKPVAAMLLNRDATVTVCHLCTKNLAHFTREAEILIVAIGCSEFIKGDMIKEGAIIIDVGINRNEKGKITGDVDFESVFPKCSHITPVPGGVGPMTIAMLLKNTLMAAEIYARG
ncbi:MAG: bifunctional methylenetetrahydrofolate dehydrogenase/methenyltetrahydrofolate cyclohydrolase FolD [Candidatus Mycalebacterium zealandia]|nr:MAG: bifunctional methylenetetrahydrofolate dehydrogenase/methenyltetrahydrofolate cyclohydrolase FolD [Candidatus Mycalebacterium zealandia]